MRVATHASDIDGVVSAALVLMKYPNAKIDFLTLRDLRLVSDVEYDLVIDLPKLPKAKANVDHHLSNYEKLVKDKRITEKDLIDPKAPSAADLLIKYLNLEDNPKARKLVELANIADTGGYTKEIYILDKIIKCHSNEPDILHKIAWILVDMGSDFMRDNWIINEWKRIKPWLEKGRKIGEKIVKEALKKGIKYLIVDLISGYPRLAISDLQWLFLNKGGNVIIVINRMTEQDPVCPRITRGNLHDTVRISLRVSKNCNFDGRKLAEMLGGGGHEKAAGARFRGEEYFNMLAKVLDELSNHGVVGYVKIQK